VRVLFIRHGDTDYTIVESRGVRGWATSFAPLSAMGRLQIDTIARDYRLQEANAILCSSYARALESAALLSRALNKPFYVEYDLHEWLPHKDSLADVDSSLIERARASLLSPAPGEDAPWESLDEVRERVLGVLRKYAHLDTVVVVSHAVVIASVVGAARMIDHAEIVPYEFDDSVPLPTHESHSTDTK
jgi:broad specificity phosphatase PhoE